MDPTVGRGESRPCRPGVAGSGRAPVTSDPDPPAPRERPARRRLLLGRGVVGGRRERRLSQCLVEHVRLLEPVGQRSASPSAGASDPAGSPAASPGTDGLPGGTAGREELSDGWLDDQGRLFYGEAAPPEKKQQALCSYLFGTPAEVGRTARLKGTVTLAPQSGYAVLGSNGVGFQCGYAVGGTTTFSLVAWSKQLDGSTGKALHLVEARLSRGGFGYSAYAPAYKGATMSDATAKRWLELAGTRVRGS